MVAYVGFGAFVLDGNGSSAFRPGFDVRRSTDFCVHDFTHDRPD